MLRGRKKGFRHPTPLKKKRYGSKNEKISNLFFRKTEVLFFNEKYHNSFIKRAVLTPFTSRKIFRSISIHFWYFYTDSHHKTTLFFYRKKLKTFRSFWMDLHLLCSLKKNVQNKNIEIVISLWILEIWCWNFTEWNNT